MKASTTNNPSSRDFSIGKIFFLILTQQDTSFIFIEMQDEDRRFGEG